MTIVKLNLLVLLTLLGIGFTQGQSLLNQKSKYTMADTLRGSVSPERRCYDVTYYDLRVKIDTSQKSISGSNRIVFTAVDNFTTLQIDLFDSMRVIEITSAGQVLRYRRQFNAIFVEMPEPVKAGARGEITISYYGVPTIAKRAPWDGGFTWSYDKNGHPWIAVACEGMGASCWWPCKDYLGDEPDSMHIACNVPEELRCVANGKEEPARQEGDGTTTYNWHISYPINNYNVSLNIGDYVSFNDEYIAQDGSHLALDYYVMRYNLDKARLQFMQVKPMLHCYEQYLGKYPFWNDGYALVETPYLGMEHQGAIAYGNRYLTGYAGTDYSRIGLDFDYIIIHESGHEWWGNSVSCRDIADMWIHEGFCTYTESIYVECMFGKDTALKYINAHKSHVGNKAPVVGIYGVNEEGDGDMYAKGSLFLNTLRTVVNNDKQWWALIKGMCDTTFKMKNIGYEDVLTYFNQKTGRDLGPVFEQYLKQAAIPVFEYRLKKIKKGEFEMSYRWNTDVKNFKMPAVFSTANPLLTFLNATNEFQTTIVKIKKEGDLKIRDDLMYIEVEKTL